MERELVTYRKAAYSVRTIQSGFCNITHCVLDSPDDTVHEQLELVRWDTQQCCNDMVNVKRTSEQRT